MKYLLTVALLVPSFGCAGPQSVDRCVSGSRDVGRLLGVAAVICSISDIPPEKCERASAASDLANRTFMGVCELLKP